IAVFVPCKTYNNKLCHGETKPRQIRSLSRPQNSYRILRFTRSDKCVHSLARGMSPLQRFVITASPRRVRPIGGRASCEQRTKGSWANTGVTSAQSDRLAVDGLGRSCFGNPLVRSP